MHLANIAISLAPLFSFLPRSPGTCHKPEAELQVWDILPEPALRAGKLRDDTHPKGARTDWPAANQPPTVLNSMALHVKWQVATCFLNCNFAHLGIWDKMTILAYQKEHWIHSQKRDRVVPVLHPARLREGLDVSLKLWCLSASWCVEEMGVRLTLGDPNQAIVSTDWDKVGQSALGHWKHHIKCKGFAWWKG